MLRIVIIAHAPLASAMRTVAAHIDPAAAAGIGVCDIRADQSLDEAVQDGQHVLATDAQADVLILTDAFGATPSNAAQRLCSRPGIRVVCGLNVPMLWRTLGHLNEPIDQVAELARAGGHQGVMLVTPARPQHQAIKPDNHDSNHDHHQQ
jgi:mannose PTS system EIIA component